MPLADLETGLKHCSSKECQQANPQPISAFRKNRKATDGLRCRCKVCECFAASAFRKAYPEKMRIYRAKHYKANPEKQRKRTAAWRNANPEKVVTYCKANYETMRKRSTAWRKANPEKGRARSAEYHKANPEKLTIRNQRKRARQRSLPHQSYDWQRTLEHFANRCAYCTEWEFYPADKLYQDHLIPIAQSLLPDELKGSGGTTPWNMVPACKRHNSSKYNKNPHTWDNPGTRWANILGLWLSIPLESM